MSALPTSAFVSDMQSKPGRLTRRLRQYGVFAFCLFTGLLLTKLFIGNLRPGIPTNPAVKHTQQADHKTAVVVASQKGENTTWLDEFPEWHKAIYVTNDPKAELTVPANKGREGMVYLTYIIDNYDHLPETMIFSHSTRYQWHNDDPFFDGYSVLRRLNLSHVQAEGYVNLRCVWTLGCPSEIRPLVEAEAPYPASDPHSEGARAGSFYKAAFEELFPGAAVPETVAASCCAQFAASADKIRERPKSDYERYRNWLLQTPLRDHLSGRIMEYTWHIIFGKEGVHCPNAKECYCKTFGLCGLDCESAGICRAAYTLPTYSTMPQGWPDYDQEHRWRNSTALTIQFEEENRSPRGRD